MKVSRRSFLGQIGAGAAGGAVLSQFGQTANAQNAARDDAWTAPPKLTKPNILFIIVDQMRYPAWLGPNQMSVYQSQLIPNITNLIANKSYGFDQYYTCATVCTAARGTLLSGLYGPQTGCYTETNQSILLQSAFPTWATGIQAVNSAYKNNVWWFGKWHLSTCNTTEPLQAWGFQTGNYPGGPNKNPDPKGVFNEGTNGGQYKDIVLASDAEIAGDFVDWIGGLNGYSVPSGPWCATVSLINPHDIANAPKLPPTYFPKPTFPPPDGAPAVMKAIPSPWNYEDLSTVANKPPLQLAFQQNKQQHFGKINYPGGWVSFLNDYYWLQNYVDIQIGLVMSALANSPFANNTIVVFTADHGDFGGSHGLHDKGMAAYDEGIRVPFYVAFPGQTAAVPMGQMCSSVDVFGLFCDLASGGSGKWATLYPDLAPRQSIWNFLYQNSAETRVCAALGNLPYIFHTCDETSSTPPTDNQHVVCMRTKNTTAQPGGKYCTYSSWAPCTVIPNLAHSQDFEFYDYNPNGANNAYEMGNDYYNSNPVTVQTLSEYVPALGVWGPTPTGLIASELNRPLVGTGTDGKPLTDAQATAQAAYFKYLGNTCSS